MALPRGHAPPPGTPRGGTGGALPACQHRPVRNRRPTRVARSAPLAVALLLLTGCADRAGTTDTAATGSTSSSSLAADSTASASASTSPSASAATSAAADVRPFPGDTAPDVADPVAPDALTVTAVRAAHHDGYDRVVFELSGTGTPGWSVEYVDTPASQGSGDVVDVPGTAYLQVTLQGTSYPHDSGATEQPRGAVDAGDSTAVAGVFYDATFEGTSVAWVGTSDRAPFRVYSLTGPSRVVVEVAAAG